MSSQYKIAIVPPGGQMIEQDFFLHRMSYFFRSNDCETYLIQINTESNQTNNDATDYTINVDDEKNLFAFLEKGKFDLILHRCWMHRYAFAGRIAQHFENSILYIKDWMDEIPREQYEMIYTTGEDYDGIRTIFESGRRILSHYTQTYTNKLAEKYCIPKERFHFFPEFCNQSNFHRRQVSYTGTKKLLWAGGFITTSKPRQLCAGKLLFDSWMRITKQNICIDAKLLKKTYNRIFHNGDEASWLDWIYESKYNEYFNITLGEEINPKVFDDYHFGIAALMQYDESNLTLPSTCSAVVSKIALYLEAGLPIIVHEKWEGIAQMVDKHGIGIVIRNEDLESIAHILSMNESQYLQLIENVYTFRKQYTYNRKTMKPILDMLQHNNNIALNN